MSVGLLGEENKSLIYLAEKVKIPLELVRKNLFNNAARKKSN